MDYKNIQTRFFFITVLVFSGISNANETAIDAESIELGRRIYQEGILPSGEPLKAIVQGDIEVDGPQLNCMSCHQRSGLGSAEGQIVIPPISGQVLHQPRYRGRWEFNYDLVIGPNPRPAYTDETLFQVVASGVDAAGRQLDPLMPRYELDAENYSYLVAYLKTLSSRTAPGIEEKHIHFASVIAEDIDPLRRQAMEDVFKVFLNDKNHGYRFEHAKSRNPTFIKERKQRAFREWVIHQWILEGPAETWSTQLQEYYRQRPVFALLSGLADQSWQPIHDFCEQQQMPCIFPNTDLPVISDSDFYTVYFSKGMTLEAQILAKYLSRQRTSDADIIQVYRTDDAHGSTAAAALREHLPASLSDYAIAAKTELADDFWENVTVSEDATARQRQRILVLWLKPDDLKHLLTVTLPDKLAAVEKIYLSSSLSSEMMADIPMAWRDKINFVHPFALPKPRSQGVIRTTAWLKAKKVPVSHVRVQANALAALTISNAALLHMVDYFSRDYFLEKLEHGADDFLTTAVYNRFSLGLGQRFASKGAYITRLTDEQPPAMEPVSDWIIP